MGVDYYKTLGIDKNASEDEIKRAYKKLAIKWHPDKNQQNKKAAESKFKEVAEAYDVLRDSKKRGIYDKFGEEGLKSGSGGMPNYKFEGSDLFDQLFNRGGSARNFSNFSSFFGSSDGSAFEFSFPGHSNGFSSMNTPKRRKKPDPMEINVNCSLEDLFRGCEKKIKITRRRFNPHTHSLDIESKNLVVNVKPGWKEGTKITYQKEGNQTSNSTPGDVIFEIKELQSDQFIRRKDNLVKPLKCKLAKLYTGFDYSVRGIDGKMISTHIPGTHYIPETGLKHVVPKEGMPVSKYPGVRGDLILEIGIKLPKLSHEEIEKIKEI